MAGVLGPYVLNEVEALRFQEGGRAKGKVVTEM
jgi:hypothetical protein